MIDEIEVTKSAQDHISEILKTENSSFFRITVLGGGCAGFQYKFDFSEKRGALSIITLSLGSN